MKKVIVNGEQLSEDQVEDIYYALSARIGYIETGTINRAVDIQNSNPGYVPKILHSEQTEAILRMEKLMENLL